MVDRKFPDGRPICDCNVDLHLSLLFGTNVFSIIGPRNLQRTQLGRALFVLTVPAVILTMVVAVMIFVAPFYSCGVSIPCCSSLIATACD